VVRRVGRRMGKRLRAVLEWLGLVRIFRRQEVRLVDFVEHLPARILWSELGLELGFREIFRRLLILLLLLVGFFEFVFAFLLLR